MITLKQTNPWNCGEAVLAILESLGVAAGALRITKGGFPEHPLRLPRSCRPTRYLGRGTPTTERTAP